jgi:hypothetical protein
VGFLSGLQFSPRSVPLALLLLCILTYGLLIFRMGFYWDDWPWIWISHLEGARGLLEIDRLYRPLAGVILWAGSVLAGKSPIAWQVLNLVFRWLTGLTLWWALRKVWPRHLERSLWIALIFLVYPGFSQQFVSVNSSRHILPLAVFFLSIGFMVQASRVRERYWLYTAIALVLGAISLLSTDYYYGLELIRPLILWYVAAGSSEKNLDRLRRTLLSWVPYLAMFAGLVLWRYTTSLKTIYPARVVRQFSNQPLTALSEVSRAALEQFYDSALVAWTKLVDFPARSEIGLLRLSIFWLIVGAALVFCLIYLTRFLRDRAGQKIAVQLVGLGILSLLVGGLPFLAADIPMGLEFPDDRSMLPMIFGASLLFVGIIDLLPVKRVFKILLLSLAVSLAVGVQVINAFTYQDDWQVQSSFLRQLTTRAPGLQPDSAIVYEYTSALQGTRFSDNSLTAALNWSYAPQLDGSHLPYFIYDLRLQTGPVQPALASGAAIESTYGGFTYSGSSEDLLMVQFSPPWCLHVLEPEHKQLYPDLPNNLSRAIRHTNRDLIQADPDQPATLPAEIFVQQPEADWCTLYQQADLARQLEDWGAIAELAPAAFQHDDHPIHAVEVLPFIQAYGHTGSWEQAEDLTRSVFEQDSTSQPVLCYIWDDFVDDTPESAARESAAARVVTLLGCQ